MKQQTLAMGNGFGFKRVCTTSLFLELTIAKTRLDSFPTSKIVQLGSSATNIG
jgi:hypothetical protein